MGEHSHVTKPQLLEARCPPYLLQITGQAAIFPFPEWNLNWPREAVGLGEENGEDSGLQGQQAGKGAGEKEKQSLVVRLRSQPSKPLCFSD